MGYACPVCETPQRDANHLANHLAFTAMVHGDEHEAWLDEHVPDWAEMGEADLGPEVAALAPETDYDQVFEDTAHAHGHDRQRGGSIDDVDPASAAAAGRGSLDEEAQRVLEEARELTAEMLDADESEEGGEDGDADEGEEQETDGIDPEE